MGLSSEVVTALRQRKLSNKAIAAKILTTKYVRNSNKDVICPDLLVTSSCCSRALEMFKTCSMFGAWGPRTTGGDLRSGRNLDWLAQTGIAKNKLITVRYLPSQSRHVSIPVGFF